MNTCLSKLWEDICPKITELLNIDYDDPRKSDLIIYINSQIDDLLDSLNNGKYYKEGEFSLFDLDHNKKDDYNLAHLSELKAALSAFNINKDEFSEHIQKALELCIDCNLCYKCSNCALHIYQGICEKKIKYNSMSQELESYFSHRSQISHYLNYFDSQKKYASMENQLIFLKGFSSSTPALHSASFTHSCTGGGFYLNINGVGIVVDPGVGFVSSMHNHNISISDINRVIITHNHIDHNSDAPILSSLLHDYNRYILANEKIHTLFDKQNQLHSIKWIVDNSSKSALSGKIENNNAEVLNDFLSNPVNIGTDDNPIMLSSIKTEHDSKIDSYGLKLTFSVDNKQMSIGYTSDTIFLDNFQKFFNSLDILILNISDIYSDDIRQFKPKHTHLGYSGSFKLLNCLTEKPTLAIVSEFCCTNGDMREQVVKKLVDDLRYNGYDKIILPGEVGMEFDLRSNDLRCSICNRFIPLEDITVVNSKHEFGELQFICKNCLISK